MQFGWLNLTGLIIVLLMMLPNIIFALRHGRVQNKRVCKPAFIIEQAGRCGCMALMVLPLPAHEFGFASPEEFIFWAILCAALLLAYFALWTVFFRRPSLHIAVWLAILPSAVFILRGIFLRHWLLTVSGIIFAIGHIYITWCSNKQLSLL